MTNFIETNEDHICQRIESPSMVTAEMVERAANNDQDAKSQIYTISYKTVYYTAKKYMSVTDNADDIAQETFLKAFESLETLKDKTQFTAWIKAIAKNKAINAQKKENHSIPFSQLKPPEDSDGDEDDFSEGIIDMNTDPPETAVIKKEIREYFSQLTQSLTDTLRLPFVMYYYQEMPIREIAENLGIPESTVKSRLHYAREKMTVKMSIQNGNSLCGLSVFMAFFKILQKMRSRDTDESMEKHPSDQHMISAPSHIITSMLNSKT